MDPKRASRDRISPLDWARSAGAVEPVLRSIEHHVRRRRRQRVLGAGSALAVLCVAAFVWRAARINPVEEPATIVATASVHAPMRQVLPDGSVVEHEPGAALQVRFSDSYRRVSLDNGVAHFAVAKDAQRPFVVEAAGFAVRAVGTEFAVTVDAAAVDVIVTEGRVRVTEAAMEPAALVDEVRATGHGASLGAGERIQLSTVARTIPERPEQVTARELQARLAWRVPRIGFSGAPLAEVVVLFNQHADAVEGPTLVLADSSLGQLPLSGVLRADNTAALFAILESSYGLKTREGNPGERVIFRP